jgi:hypothetical protein
MIFKLLGNEIDINSTANDVYTSVLVRVVNRGTANTILIQKYSNGVQFASTTVLGNSEIVIQKSGSDIIIGANMVATPIAYKY